ncbi:dicarboxylate/amino acid:cation symporter [Halioxenophilus sp. WMMB6]|uniref:dicarboxylate/amino acid:cation symporter n=1 Tax=Halioxenophilus sp. WMMB6 TaxID=3073815 RepID=UPI00295ED32E|nr:dicarboxylate/amino acid:cation symporter [Halioxenophilus sp. WMMB6]
MSVGFEQHRRVQLDQIIILAKTRLWIQILIAMVLGFAVGLSLSPEGLALVPAELSLTLAEWLQLPGTIFLNLIQMVVIPLVISSIALGICGGGDNQYLKRAGLRIFPYFIFTTVLAVVIGIVLVEWIHPGAYIDRPIMSVELADLAVPASTFNAAAVPDKIAELIPNNLSVAFSTKNMIQIVVAAIISGIAIASLPEERVVFAVKLLELAQEISLKVVSWAMLLAPLAVFGLLADISIRVGISAIAGLAAYVATVLIGLICLYLFYLLLIKVLGGKSPLLFAKHIRDVQLLAFSTSSSAAVMPLSMKVAIEQLRLSPPIVKFIIPIGATVNMDGTALYQVIAAVFLTQVFGIDLSVGQFALLTITTVGASIGAPSTPGVGIVILTTILQSIGVPASGIALIIGVDRILDMCRTAVNVTGDLTACTIMDKWLVQEPKSEPMTITSEG